MDKTISIRNYTNQQTVYQMLIQAELGLSVESLEILPYVVDYGWDETNDGYNIYNLNVSNFVNGAPLRLMLPISTEMQQLYTTQPDTVNEAWQQYQQLKLEIDTQYNTLDQYLSELSTHDSLQIHTITSQIQGLNLLINTSKLSINLLMI